MMTGQTSEDQVWSWRSLGLGRLRYTGQVDFVIVVTIGRLEVLYRVQRVMTIKF